MLFSSLVVSPCFAMFSLPDFPNRTIFFCNKKRKFLQFCLTKLSVEPLVTWVFKTFDEEIKGTDLSDAWVGALDVPGGEVEPAAGVGGDWSAVLPHGASALAAAPAALELPVRPQTHATAVPLSAALVEVN